jgi:hypothetical protein
MRRTHRRRSCARGNGLHCAGGTAAIAALALATASCSGSSIVGNGDDVCQPDDADGVLGGDVAFELTVDDTGFSPAILAAQNLANVTLTLHNAGAKPHDFVLDCMPTPNPNGCPYTSCFPSRATISAVAPGASAMATFVVPNPEGIYDYHSSIAGDAPPICMAGLDGCGQFIVK